MQSAPEAFMAVANATAAIVAKAPPFISYRVTGTVHYLRGDAAVARTVVVRTTDGDAVVRDDASGGETVRPPFPAPPTFDALAHWRLEGDWSASGGANGSRDVDLRVINIEPLRYAPVPSHADAVAHAVRGYRIAYGAPDGATPHLHLTPTPQYFAGTPRTAWLTDVWYDPVTMIPSRVLIAGRDDFALDARYALVDGAWLLRSIRVAQTFRPLLGLARIAAWFSGEYLDYRFSDTAPDSRIAPASSSPASTGRTEPTSAPAASRS